MQLIKYEGCPFCGDNRKQFLRQNCYEVDKMYFYEDDFFTISADISPLVPGHLLVIPKGHYKCMGEIRQEGLMSKIYTITENIFKNHDLFYFEHGAVVEGKGGASIDHAHLHVLPRPKTLNEAEVDRYIRQYGCVISNEIVIVDKELQDLALLGHSYLFYSFGHQGYAYQVEKPPHQFFRMMLKKYCSIDYNWRRTYLTDECKANVLETVEYIGFSRDK